jgi:hypothetical protein
MFGEPSRDRDSKQMIGRGKEIFTSQLLPFFSLIVEEYVLPNLTKPNSIFDGIWPHRIFSPTPLLSLFI